MDTIRIALVDDQLLFRQAMAVMISSEHGLSLVMQANNGSDCLLQLQSLDTLPDLALIDMEMPEMDGMQLTEELQKKYPSIKVVILSVHSRERLIARMIQAGASGYLFKNCDKEELLLAIRTIHSSGFYINPAVLKAIQSVSSPGAGAVKNATSIPVELSKREQEILQLICREQSNAEIAEQLFLSVRTVEGHRNNLLQKTGCRNTAGLVLFAVKYHLFELA
ncbi:MAG: response regulator transcription factor [Chitinophagaceae bacterium]|nr:response regulator transcription factor [Chitinophagaceae bacterium]